MYFPNILFQHFGHIVLHKGRAPYHQIKVKAGLLSTTTKNDMVWRPTVFPLGQPQLLKKRAKKKRLLLCHHEKKTMDLKTMILMVAMVMSSSVLTFSNASSFDSSKHHRLIPILRTKLPPDR